MELVTFDAEGYRVEPRAANLWVFHAPTGDLVQLWRFDLAPDIGAALDDEPAVRAMYRERVARAGAGLVAVDCVTVAAVRAVRVVIKAPMEPRGRIYVGSLTLPFRDFSYVLKVECREQAATGVREAIVMAKVALPLDANNELAGWFADPYEPSARGPMVRNLSEDEQYDPLFPEHPLTRVRSLLGHVERTLAVDPKVRAAPPFTGPR
jgi:hypothetical protein